MVPIVTRTGGLLSSQSHITIAAAAPCPPSYMSTLTTPLWAIRDASVPCGVWGGLPGYLQGSRYQACASGCPSSPPASPFYPPLRSPAMPGVPLPTSLSWASLSSTPSASSLSMTSGGSNADSTVSVSP